MADFKTKSQLSIINPGKDNMVSNMNIQAIIWDYDGTLVDTLHKNLNATKRIIEAITKAYFAIF